jgi:hypothetical protein
MASTWIVTRTTSSGEKRYRVEFRCGGRESPTQYGGSFKTKREADERKRWVAGELAAKRVPELRFAEQGKAPALAAAGTRWLASRIDVAESTRTRHGLELARIEQADLGSRPVNELTPADVAAFVAALAQNYSRGTLRKQLQTVAMILHHEGGSPNPARDREVRLPREESEELNPPTAEHAEAVYRRLPSKHRHAFLFLDWSGARVSAIDPTLVGDYDEPRRARPSAEAGHEDVPPQR